MKNHSSKEERFEKLIAPHMNRLYQSAYRLTGSREAAEDLVQEMLVRLYPKISELQGVDRPGAWLKKVLYRQFVDGLRKRSRRPEQYIDDNPGAVDGLESQGDSPEKRAEAAEIRQHLEAALSRLDASSRLIVVMHFVEGYTLPEMAEIHNLPLETIKTRLRRAKNRLKKFLQM